MIKGLIDKRLYEIKNMIIHSNLVADIGTDHAYLPVVLVKENRCNGAVASDIADGPVFHAKQTVAKFGCTKKIQVVKAAGLDGIEAFSPDTIVIAGMGGEMIKSILSLSEYPRNSRCRLILQPMTNPDVLRRYLCDEGFCTVAEIAVCEKNHRYVIMDCCYSGEKKEYNQIYLQLGKLLETKNQEHVNYILGKLESTRKALNGMKNAENPDIQKIDLLKEIIKECEEYLK